LRNRRFAADYPTVRAEPDHKRLKKVVIEYARLPVKYSVLLHLLQHNIIHSWPALLPASSAKRVMHCGTTGLSGAQFDVFSCAMFHQMDQLR
jgi:hypothetical protein